MGGIRRFFRKVGKAISKALPTVATIAGVATGNPALLAAGSALGSLDSSKAQNQQIEAANAAAVSQTNYNNQVIQWQNAEGQRQVDLKNAEIDHQNEANRLTTDYENTQIAIDNATAKANDALKRRQIDDYNRRGIAASKAEQDSILNNLRSTYSTLDEQEYQESLQSSQQKMQRIRQGIRERGELSAIAAESGVKGRSVSRDAIASAIWQAEDVGTIETNLGFTKNQIARERKGAQANAQSNLNKSVFYEQEYDLASPMTPFKPSTPEIPHVPNYNPQPLQGQPVETPTLSTTDIALRAVGSGLSTYYTYKRPTSGTISNTPKTTNMPASGSGSGSGGSY